jgi:Ras family protein T1
MLNFDFLPFFSISVVDDFKVAEELTRADAVVFTYACDEPTTLERLSTFWLPKICKLEVSILHYPSVFIFLL